MQTSNAIENIYSWNALLWEQLQNYFSKNRVPQAMIINGQKGLGKIAIAKQFSALLLCHRPVESNACGCCASCCLIKQGSHVDFIFITAEEGSNIIKIEQIRDLSLKLTKSAAIGKRKVAIIDGADNMQDKAANSLLKTLEEPFDNTTIILTTNNIAQVAATIKSRCNYIPVIMPKFEEVTDFLSKNTGASADDIRLAYHFALQAPLAALDALGTTSFKKIIEQVKTCYVSKDISPVDLTVSLKSEDLIDVIKASYLIIYELIHFKIIGSSYCGHVFKDYDVVHSLVSNVDIYDMYNIYDYHNDLFAEISVGTVWQSNTMLISLSSIWNKYFKG